MSDIILSLDTSNSSCSVCLSRGVKILAYTEELRPHMQAERLLDMIESALLSANLSYQDLGYLSVITGPGSFTGIRIGLAAASGIFMALPNLIGVPISALEAYAHRATMQVNLHSFDSIIVLINAYRGQVYFQEFDKNRPNSSPVIMDNAAAVEFLHKSSGRIVCAGNAVEIIYDQIKQLDNITILPRFPRLKARHFASLAHEKIKAQDFVELKPLYIRPPDAKVSN